MARKKGQAPANEQAARARIEEFQKKNPSAVAKDPEPKKVAAVAPRVETVAGRTKMTIQVQEGDSLWAISQKHGVTVDELCRWNGIKNPRRIKLQIGQELVVYPKPADIAPSPAPKPG
jgi:LysM repeat protein